MLVILALLLSIDPEEAKFLDALNTYRVQSGLGKLVVSEQLQDAARWMAYDMARTSSPSHQDSKGRTPQQRMVVFGYPIALSAENANGGYASGQVSADNFYNACDPISSQVPACTHGHRNNMLGLFYTEVGIGRAYVPDSEFKYYWVVDFATRSGSTTPPPVVIPDSPVIIPDSPKPPPVVTPPDPPIPSTEPDIIEFIAARSGTYQLTIVSPYGFRLYADDALIMDRWGVYPPSTYKIRRFLLSGKTQFKIQHYQPVNKKTFSISVELIP